MIGWFPRVNRHVIGLLRFALVVLISTYLIDLHIGASAASDCRDVIIRYRVKPPDAVRIFTGSSFTLPLRLQHDPVPPGNDVYVIRFQWYQTNSDSNKFAVGPSIDDYRQLDLNIMAASDQDSGIYVAEMECRKRGSESATVTQLATTSVNVSDGDCLVFGSSVLGVIGDQFVLRLQCSAVSAVWWFQIVEGHGEVLVAGGKTSDDPSDGFSMNQTGDGQFDLVIPALDRSQLGLYVAKADLGAKQLSTIIDRAYNIIAETDDVDDDAGISATPSATTDDDGRVIMPPQLSTVDSLVKNDSGGGGDAGTVDVPLQVDELTDEQGTGDGAKSSKSAQTSYYDRYMYGLNYIPLATFVATLLVMFITTWIWCLRDCIGRRR